MRDTSQIWLIPNESFVAGSAGCLRLYAGEQRRAIIRRVGEYSLGHVAAEATQVRVLRAADWVA
jgi:hypothetical protein